MAKFTSLIIYCKLGPIKLPPHVPEGLLVL